MNGRFELLRTSAEEKLSRIAVPTVKDENYRFTSLKDVQWNRVARAVPELREIPETLGARTSSEAACAVVRSGSPELKLSRMTSVLKPRGVTIESWAQAAARSDVWSEQELVPQSLERDLFAQLCLARATTGVVIRVPQDTVVDLPMRALHWFDEASDAFFSRTLIWVGERSQVRLVDEFGGDGTGSAPFAGHLLQVFAGRDARIEVASLQGYSPRTQFFSRQMFSLRAGSEVNWVSCQGGGLKSQSRTDVHFEEEGGRMKILGGARARDEQHFDFWVNLRHQAGRTQSQCDYFTVASDRSRVVFNGNVEIDPGCSQTEAFQKNRNLVLSGQAAIETFPKLVIANDDVKCAHGATVSAIEPEQLYYLQARGIPPIEAEQMIVSGFTQPVADALSSEDLRARAIRIFEGRSAQKWLH
jgi:Fe-S cluster assembly protein SufD